MTLQRETPGPGQESVWDYPRPPAVEMVARHARVTFNGVVIAETDAPLRVSETSHPPTYYIPFADIAHDYLSLTGHHTVCEFKGVADYYTVTAGERAAQNAAWFYPDPEPGFEVLRDAVAFYPQLMDEITLDGKLVTPQPGRFYGGWVTDEVVGPFKGAPGTLGW